MGDKCVIASFDGMAWPVTGNALDGLGWRLRYGEHVDSDTLQAASVIQAYGNLIRMSQRDRNEMVKKLRAHARPATGLSASDLGAKATQSPGGQGPGSAPALSTVREAEPVTCPRCKGRGGCPGGYLSCAPGEAMTGNHPCHVCQKPPSARATHPRDKP